MEILPEYAVPHLVYLLAHHPQFDEKHLEDTAKYLGFFLDHIYHGDNFYFLAEIFDGIRYTKDARHPDLQVLQQHLLSALFTSNINY